MIFVILGSQKFQFNRLLSDIDELCNKGEIEDEIIAQVGYSTYRPKSFKTIDFIEKSEFDAYIQKSDLVICHGGTGAIITALKKGKKVIAVPRDKKYAEHVDNHQYQIVNMFSDSELIEACYDTKELKDIIKKAKYKEYKKFESNNNIFVNELRKDIEYIGSK